MQDLDRDPLHPSWISDWGVLLAVLLVFVGAFVGRASPVRAQVGSSTAEGLTSRERPVRIAVHPTYQRFENEGRVLAQWSVPVVAVVPFAERWQLSLRGSGASARGEDVETLTGLSDVRVGLSYAQPIGEGSLIVNANANAPTGKEQLTRAEFNTARFLSRNFYRFRVPSFGQGFGAGTGLTLAFPVAESIVLGIGGSFRYHGSYSPAVSLQEEYDPGEEVRLTAGVDFRLNQLSALSADLSFFTYGADTVGGVERFQAGNQFSARVQYLRESEQQTIRVVGYYRQQEKSTLPLRSDATRSQQVLPSHGMLRGRYTVGLMEGFDLRLSATGHWYGETTGFESKTLLTGGVEPRITVIEGIVVSPQTAYTAGSITGLEGGIGLTAQF